MHAHATESISTRLNTQREERYGIVCAEHLCAFVPEGGERGVRPFQSKKTVSQTKEGGWVGGRENMRRKSDHTNKKKRHTNAHAEGQTSFFVFFARVHLYYTRRENNLSRRRTGHGQRCTVDDCLLTATSLRLSPPAPPCRVGFSIYIYIYIRERACSRLMRGDEVVWRARCEEKKTCMRKKKIVHISRFFCFRSMCHL